MTARFLRTDTIDGHGGPSYSSTTSRSGVPARRFSALFALVLLAAAYMPARGQITITATDVGTQIAAGHALVTHQDTLLTMANIGSPGSTSWNFSSLNSHVLTTLTSVAPGSTPFGAQFTGATHAFWTTATFSGITGTVYEYLTLGTNLTDLGNMAQALVSPGITAELHTTNSPADLVYALPFTLNSSWASPFTATQVISFNGQVFSSTPTTHNAVFLVDAFGPLTIPGGGTYNALRIRKQDSVTVKTVSYQIIAQNGASVQFVASDPASPNTGTIAVHSVTWTGPISTDVQTTPGIPDGFSLQQNYPNPFNPSTTIGYEVLTASRVRIVVDDVLGREVALLVDREQPAGKYAVTWDGKGMASGVYYYRMEAGTFRQTKAMLLMR